MLVSVFTNRCSVALSVFLSFFHVHFELLRTCAMTHSPVLCCHFSARRGGFAQVLAVGAMQIEDLNFVVKIGLFSTRQRHTQTKSFEFDSAVPHLRDYV